MSQSFESSFGLASGAKLNMFRLWRDGLTSRDEARRWGRNLCCTLDFQEESCLMDVGDREESFSSSTRQERDKHLVPAHRDLHRTCRGL